MTKSRVLVSGATGFVGSYLLNKGNEECEYIPVSLRDQQVEDIDFQGVKAIIHLAGIAHQTGGISDKQFDEVNHQLTKSFAEAAKNQGVSHFILMSSVKVYGLNESDQPISLNTPCQPDDAYGKSKLQAERSLEKLSSETFGVCCIRTPIVYGPGIKGNIRSLINLTNRLPVVPLGGIQNKRSMISLKHLSEYIEHILKIRYEGIVLPADPIPCSTSGLVKEICKHLSRPPVIINPPKIFWSILKRLKPQVYDRLIGSLELDSSQSNQLLGFEPTEPFKQGVARMMLEKE